MNAVASTAASRMPLKQDAHGQAAVAALLKAVEDAQKPRPDAIRPVVEGLVRDCLDSMSHIVTQDANACLARMAHTGQTLLAALEATEAKLPAVIEQLTREAVEKLAPRQVQIVDAKGLVISTSAGYRRPEFDEIVQCVAAGLKVLLVGPAGCLHADSVIVDPVDGSSLTVESRYKLGRPFHVTSLCHTTGRLIPALALPPVKYAPTMIFRVTTRSGRTFKVTGEHRLLTTTGYVRVCDAETRLRASVAVHLPCVVESGPQAHTANDRHSTQTVADSQYGYRREHRSYGGRPLLAPGIGRSLSPSRAGARARSRYCLRVGGPVLGATRNRGYQLSGHQSTRDCSAPPAQSGQSRPPSECGAASGDSCRASVPSPASIAFLGTHERPSTSRPRPTGAACADSAYESPVSWPTEPGLSQESASGFPHRTSPAPASQSGRPQSTPTLPHQMVGFCDSPSVHSWCTDIDDIAEIEPIGAEHYYDFHVPIHNNYLHNEAIHHNCGKTTLAREIATALNLPFGFLSLSAGISEAHLVGRFAPIGENGRFVYVPAPFVTAFKTGGVFLLDEVDAADPNVLLVINAALANGVLATPNPDEPFVSAHADFRCLAAANTWGTGADRQYVGRNQLDASTLDRFGALFALEYDERYEQQVGHPDVVAWVHQLRRDVRAKGIRRVVSTRLVIDGTKRLAIGHSMAQVQKSYFLPWSESERRQVGYAA